MNKLNNFYKILIINAVALPSIAFSAPTTFKGLIEFFIYYIQQVIPIVFGFAFIGFLWGLMKYIFAAGNENEKENGKNIMVWGLIGIFFLTSIIAIVSMVGGTLLPNFGGRNWPGDSGNNRILNTSPIEDALPQE